MAVKSKALTNWQAEVEADAQAASAMSVAGGNFISIRGGKFSINGNVLKEPQFDAVIPDFIMENAYYEGDFDPDNPQPPACYAFARPEVKNGAMTVPEMAPHPQAAKPQNKTCKGCKWNEFGSADRGKSKACKNIRRLAVMLPEQLDDLQSAEVMYLKIPVTSVKGWSGYVDGLRARYKRPPYAMVTQIRVEPDPKSQYKLHFAPVGPVDMDVYYKPLKEKIEEIKLQIVMPYPAPKEEVEEPKPRRRKF